MQSLNGWPRMRMDPWSGMRMRMIMRNVLVLPAPFGPSRPKMAPRRIRKLKSLTAVSEL